MNDYLKGRHEASRIAEALTVAHFLQAHNVESAAYHRARADEYLEVLADHLGYRLEKFAPVKTGEPA